MNFDIETDIEIVHRGMAFLSSGRELGYITVIRWAHHLSYRIDYKFAAFSEKTGKCIHRDIQEKKDANINGHLYKYVFVDNYGETVYVE